MYPDLEAYKDNDLDDRRNSYFEKNCNQIFSKGPILTKEILEKVNAEIVPKKTYMFGYELKTKRVLLIAGLCLLFSTSFFGAIVAWFTDTLDNIVLSQLVLSNGSDSFKMWKNPSAKAVYNIYIFNYTNVEEYKYGTVDKLNLQEVGPYAYEETLEKLEISFPTEDTLSFRDKRTLMFRPDLSKGKPNDTLIVPNLSVISGSAMAKPLNYFSQLGYNAILSSMGQEAFMPVQAGDFISGYEDKLYSIARTFLPDEMPSRMGLLTPRMGISPQKYTIHTGKRDMDKYGVIQKINGENELDYFSGSCNSIAGTDGGIYPPRLVRNKKPLHYFFPQACRRMPLIFEKESTVMDGKIPVYQYVHPENFFDSVEENPENACFCNMDEGECPVKGLLNITKCNYGVPMFISHPHFHRADPKLLEPFSGLNPDGDYKSYIKVHPTMGFAIAARDIVQVNVRVMKADSVSKMDMFDDGMVLPIAWMEGVLNDKTHPQDFVDTINLVTFTVPSIKLALKYGLLLTSIITLACLVLVLRRKSQEADGPLPDRLLRTEYGHVRV